MTIAWQMAVLAREVIIESPLTATGMISESSVI